MKDRVGARVRRWPARARALLIGATAVALAACGEMATLPVSAGTGPRPTLPAPNTDAVPDRQHRAGERLAGRRDAAGRAGHAGGRVRRAAWTTRAGCSCCPTATCWWPRPTRRPSPTTRKGVKGWVMGMVMKRAGAAVPSANRITLLRDTDGDGVADQRSVLLEGLNSPFGMALVGEQLYVANSDAVLRFPYATGDTRITGARRQAGGPAGRPDQPPLDQESHRQPGRQQALRDRGLEQQRRRTRHGGRGRTRRDLGGGHAQRHAPRVRLRPAQPQRHGVGASAAARRCCGRWSTSATNSAATWSPTT